MTRPLLLLGVDGVLNTGAAAQGRDGYETRTLVTDWNAPSQPRRWGAAGESGKRVRLCPGHGPMLLKLADSGLVELAWLTGWNEWANTLIAPALGLPRLPVVTVPFDFRPRNGFPWKHEAVTGQCAGRPVAWIDDEFVASFDSNWAVARAEKDSPTLLCKTDPGIGLTQDDLDAIAAWASRL